MRMNTSFRSQYPRLDWTFVFSNPQDMCVNAHSCGRTCTCGTLTHSIRQRVLIRVLRRCALLYLFQQQGVFDQAASREIQKVPQVQFPAKRRLLTQTQELLHSLIVLFVVQQGFGSDLVTAVCNVGLQAGELRSKGRVQRSSQTEHCDSGSERDL